MTGNDDSWFLAYGNFGGPGVYGGPLAYLGPYGALGSRGFIGRYREHSGAIPPGPGLDHGG